jgi:hypothetical protein
MSRPCFFAALVLGGCVAGAPDGTSQALSCPPSPAPSLFANALCLCGDFASVGTTLTTAAPTGAASVGVNGRSDVVGLDDVGGSWTAYGGMSGVGSARVRDDLATVGDIAGVGRVDVGHDLSVGGSLADVGQLAVGGTLRVQGQERVLGLAQVQATGAYAAPAGPPCPCDGSTFIDVSARVAAAKAKNDNGAHGLPTSMVTVGPSDVVLTTGSYYFDHVATVGHSRFVVDGIVALYLDGSLDVVGRELVELKPNAQLDLWVSGAVATVGQLELGTDPSALRLYVGGAGGALLSVGQQSIAGAIYAPTAEITFVGDTAIHGALFGRDLAGVGRLTLDYASPQPPPPSQCTPTPSSGGGGGSTGGTPIP